MFQLGNLFASQQHSYHSQPNCERARQWNLKLFKQNLLKFHHSDGNAIHRHINKKKRWLLLHPLPTVLMSYTVNFLFFCFCMSPSSFNSNTHLVLIAMFSSHKYIFYVYSLTNLVIKYFTHLQVVRSVPPPLIYKWYIHEDLSEI